jgi:hypothetical protein
MSLTAAAGPNLPLEDVQAAFSARSKMLVTSDFVAAYLGQHRSAFEEAEALVSLCENVIGAANKRHASRWLDAVIASLRFETELSAARDCASAHLTGLATLQRQVGRCGLAPEDAAVVQARLGAVGAGVEGGAKLVTSLVRANTHVEGRLIALLRMAAGQSAPLGPAAERARIEALRLLRQRQVC